MKQENNKTNDNLIIGRNAVLELLKSDREVENVLIAKGEREGSINRIVALCKEKKIVIKNVDIKKLDFLAPVHQCMKAGVVARLQQMAQLMHHHMFHTPSWQQ